MVVILAIAYPEDVQFTISYLSFSFQKNVEFFYKAKLQRPMYQKLKHQWYLMKI